MDARTKIATVRSALREAMGRLRAADVPSHALAAELLLMHATGRDRAWIYAHPEAMLDGEAAGKLCALVGRRAKGTPTQYLTGKQEFWGLEFEVNRAVLIPRPETEHVIEVALERLGEGRKRDRLRVADVGTGSGCIAVALASELPRAEIWATDISPAALGVARRNAERQGVGERIHFLACNLLHGIAAGAEGGGTAFDLIASNPPYIGHQEKSALAREIREHEPHQALYGGAGGTEIYGPLVAQAAALLKPGGLLVLEMGYGSAGRVREQVEKSAGWKAIRLTEDLAGIPRVISAER